MDNVLSWLMITITAIVLTLGTMGVLDGTFEYFFK